MTNQLNLQVVTQEGSYQALIAVNRLTCLGYTGRDQAKVMAHIEELARIGVKPPTAVPAVYQVPPGRASTGNSITVAAETTSGEVEGVLVLNGQKVFVAVGSDHTDRRLEAEDVPKAKAICPKVLSPRVWDFDEVKGHWDQLIIRSWVTDDKGRRLYQEDRLQSLLDPQRALAEAGDSTPGHLIFCGTAPVRGEVSYAQAWELQLEDPVLNRSLEHTYVVKVNKP